MISKRSPADFDKSTKKSYARNKIMISIPLGKLDRKRSALRQNSSQRFAFLPQLPLLSSMKSPPSGLEAPTTGSLSKSAAEATHTQPAATLIQFVPWAC